MGPQPLSKVRPKAIYRFGNGVFETHPDLSVIIIRVVNTGAMAEWRWGGMLVDLMSADVRTGMAMYEAHSGAESRRAALLAAAQSKLVLRVFEWGKPNAGSRFDLIFSMS